MTLYKPVQNSADAVVLFFTHGVYKTNTEEKHNGALIFQ